MKRRVFNVLAVVSLAACLAVMLLWVRSYRTLNGTALPDGISFTQTDPLYWITSEPGCAVLCRQTGRDWDGRELPRFRVPGIAFGGAWGVEGNLIWNLRVSYWLLTVCTVSLPILRGRGLWRERRKRRRVRAGLCPACGYDLRASPERCPECGAVVKH